MRTSLSKFFTSPLSPPCEGGERGVVNLVAGYVVVLSPLFCAVEYLSEKQPGKGI